MVRLLGSVHRAAMSLSARRAWIEIRLAAYRQTARKVALRKESVDRNVKRATAQVSVLMSLSARRAWIEMKKTLRW